MSWYGNSKKAWEKTIEYVAQETDRELACLTLISFVLEDYLSITQKRLKFI